MLHLQHLTISILSGFAGFLPLMALLFHLQKKKQHQLPRAHQAGAVLYGCYILAVLSAAGTPSVCGLTPDFSVVLLPFADLSSSLTQYVLNLILFVPLGLLLPLLWSRYRSLKKVILTGFLFSFLIEWSQLFCFRTTDINDLLMNTAGAAAGYLLYLLQRNTCSLADWLSVSKSLETEGAASPLVAQEAAICTAAAWLSMFFVEPFVSSLLWNILL